MQKQTKPVHSATPQADPSFLRLRYPSIACRPIPHFNLVIPSNWVVTEFPNALFVMGTSNGKDGRPVAKYWSNVIVHHERVLPEETLEKIARASWAALHADIPTAVLVEEGVFTFDDQRHYIREVLIPGATPKDNLNRVDSYVFGPMRECPTLDLFRFTWLNPSAAGQERRKLYIKILRSLVFDEMHWVETDPSRSVGGR